MKRTIDFGVVKYDRDRNRAKCEVEIELREDSKGRPELSVYGKVWNHTKTDLIMAGQCLDSMHINKPLFKIVKNLWKKYHLNGMHAGTPEQESYLEEHRDLIYAIMDASRRIVFLQKELQWGRHRNTQETLDKYLDELADLKVSYAKYISLENPKEINQYEATCKVLGEAGLYEVEWEGKPYRYGHAWLYMPIPKKDLALIKEIIENKNV